MQTARRGGPFAWHLDAACQTVGAGAIAIGALSPVSCRQLKARPFLVFLPFFLLPTFRVTGSTVARRTTLAVGGFVSVGFGRVALYAPLPFVSAVSASGVTVAPFTYAKWIVRSFLQLLLLATLPLAVRVVVVASTVVGVTATD